jgi:hypothetical protein
MAVLSIREYYHMPAISHGTLPAGQEPANTSQTVAIGGTSVQSAALNIRTRFVRLNCDVACSVEFGASPTAISGTCNMAAGATEYFGVVPETKIAVIAQ